MLHDGKPSTAELYSYVLVSISLIIKSNFTVMNTFGYDYLVLEAISGVYTSIGKAIFIDIPQGHCLRGFSVTFSFSSII